MLRKSYFLSRVALIALFALFVLAPLSRSTAQEIGTSVGSEQTPIDIRNEDLTFVENLPSLGFSYGTKVSLDVVNTGSPGEFATVRAVVPDGGGALTVAGVTYKLLQFHWHAPSEHELNGQKFPMEMHFVHQAADGTLSVVGVFIKSGKENKELAKIFADLPAQTNEHRAVARLNLTKLLPRNLESFRYAGSLTTPDFAEGVRWVVLAEPIEMSSEQIAAFTALFPEGNSREVQPLNGRTILTDVETHEDNDN
ncbi:MAG TPA: carbonic anhydrase family protein [Pyrinomonadaceae bacterium]|nr:carbonic anhydrase family protein [Pyrinomonadaceae bacterium]